MDTADDNEQMRQLSHSHNATATAPRKRQRTPTTPESYQKEDPGAVMAAAWLSMDNETVTHDLSLLLGPEMTLPLPVKVKIVDDHLSSSPPLIFQSSTSYVTINGNEESCGSSFSESECSVMVGISNSGFRKLAVEESDGAWDLEEARGWINGEGINASDRFLEYDYDMVEKFLGEDFCDKC